MNLLGTMAPNRLAATGLAWDHPPLEWKPLPGGEGIHVIVPPQVDYFQAPAGTHAADNAPYLRLEVAGDFVAQAHVRPAFNTQYDAAALMVRHDHRLWAKLCYERTDFGTTSAVSVVTRECSDDANGVDLSVPDLWLQILRVGDVFGMHYALDGRSWRMVRQVRMAAPQTIKIGLMAQCPIGPGTTVDFLSFTVEPRMVKNLRAGV